MERFSSFFIFVCMLNVFSSTHLYAAERCVKEKQQVDRWNSLLRQKANESRRARHRMAKEQFLLCLSQSKTAQPVQRRQVLNSNERKPPTNIQRRSTSAHVISYHSFQGEKHDAWVRFFKEPTECVNNKHSMRVFVLCTERRKIALQDFTRWWNSPNKEQAVPPLIANTESPKPK